MQPRTFDPKMVLGMDLQKDHRFHEPASHVEQPASQCKSMGAAPSLRGANRFDWKRDAECD